MCNPFYPATTLFGNLTPEDFDWSQPRVTSMNIDARIPIVDMAEFIRHLRESYEPPYAHILITLEDP